VVAAAERGRKPDPHRRLRWINWLSGAILVGFGLLALIDWLR
jgi:threonine/homoserine/homoserine lactone efflux protein